MGPPARDATCLVYAAPAGAVGGLGAVQQAGGPRLVAPVEAGFAHRPRGRAVQRQPLAARRRRPRVPRGQPRWT